MSFDLEWPLITWSGTGAEEESMSSVCTGIENEGSTLFYRLVFNDAW
jgi:hypothetical protein